MKKIYLIFSALFLTASVSEAQNHRTYSQSGYDFNHYSLEYLQYEDAFIMAGTLFKGGTTTDMQIQKTDGAGNLIWQRLINMSGNERILDMTLARKGEVAVTGYTEVSGQDMLFVAVFDVSSGAMVQSKFYKTINNAYGTNIIYNKNLKAYFVGGFFEDVANPTVPLQKGYAWVMRLDGGLNVLWSQGVYGSSNEHCTINDLTDIPGQGLFLTGSVSFTGSGQQQGVLASFIDYNGNPLNDLSFEATNSEHDGVSAVYDDRDPSDLALYVMSNNSAIHNPEITRIDMNAGISGASVTQNNYLELDPSYGSSNYTQNAAGFKLMLSHNDGALIAAGLFRNHQIGSITQNTPVWIAEFKSVNPSYTRFVTYEVTSPLFYNEGGGLFSTFSGEHPYIYEQEMICSYRDFNTGVPSYAFLAPHIIGSDYAMDFGQFDYLFEWPQHSSCYKFWDGKVNNLNLTKISAKITHIPVDFYPYGVLTAAKVKESVSPCDVTMKSLEQESSEEAEVFIVAPNPTDGVFRIEYSDGFEGSELSITDNLGHQVRLIRLQSDYGVQSVDLGDLPAGIYYLQARGNDGLLIKRIVKQ